MPNPSQYYKAEQLNLTIFLISVLDTQSLQLTPNSIVKNAENSSLFQLFPTSMIYFYIPLDGYILHS